MKKILVLLFAFCVMFPLTGCYILEEEIDSRDLHELTENSSESEFPVKQEWQSVTFKSLSGAEDLTVTREETAGRGFGISTSKYDGKYLAVAVYKTDCASCQAQAPWLDKLAENLPSMYFGMDFLIVFSDVYDNSTKVEWVQNLPHVESYTNAVSVCGDNACHDVFIPSLALPEAGTMYYVDKQDVTKLHKGITWNVEEDPQQMYNKMQEHVANFLGLKEITFNPTVDDWEEEEQ